MPARLVEHDTRTMEPKHGGRVLPATVTGVSGEFVVATAESGTMAGTIGPLYFYVESGWLADDRFGWRLEPDDKAAPAAGREERADGT